MIVFFYFIFKECCVYSRHRSFRSLKHHRCCRSQKIFRWSQNVSEKRSMMNEERFLNFSASGHCKIVRNESMVDRYDQRLSSVSPTNSPHKSTTTTTTAQGRKLFSSSTHSPDKERQGECNFRDPPPDQTNLEGDVCFCQGLY